MTCGDCVEKNRCMEQSRDYCCTSFNREIARLVKKYA